MNRCRHFLGLFHDDRPACRMNVDIRRKATQFNNNSEMGIFFVLPCTKRSQDDQAGYFRCNHLSRETDEEVEKRYAEMRSNLNPLIHNTPRLEQIKREMISNQEDRRIEDCFWCEAKSSLRIHCAIDTNQHLHCECEVCKRGSIE